jgi:putative flippase GtrA
MDMLSHEYRLLIKQLVRYGIIGVLNNLWGYLLYLLLTCFWLDPKLVVSILYPISALMAYFAHSKYSFNYDDRKFKALFRFAVSHMVGYFVNISMLFVFVDVLNYPHPLIQAMAIVVVAIVLFILFRYYVFSVSTQVAFKNAMDKK